MRKFSLRELSEITTGKLVGDPLMLISDIIIDSRKTSDPGGSMFLAIRGNRNNGHVYIQDMYNKGFRAFLVEEEFQITAYKNASFIIVQRSVESMQKIAAYIRSEFKAPVLGITGSNGKTIVKEWIFQALRTEKRIVRSPESYNSQVGVPLSVFQLDNSFDLAILEAGISEPDEMEILETIIKPSTGILTNIGSSHQENFSSLKQKTLEKLLLFSNSDRIIYCIDHKIVNDSLSELNYKAELINWGRTGNPNYLIKTSTDGQFSKIVVSGRCNFVFKIPFHDNASVENAMHVFVYLHSSGYALSLIEAAMIKLEAVAMRMEMLKALNNCTVINDSYNSDIISLSNAIHFLNQQKQHNKKTLILSDILQSGNPDEVLYREVGEIIKRNGIDRLIGIGENIGNHRKFFNVKAEFYNDTESFISEYDMNSFQNEAILLKGSRKYRFEIISASLQEQAHRTVLEIDLTALVNNYNYYKSILKPETKVMAMVKAFSYGSGGYEIASTLQYHKVDYLAVAFADEGVSLRKNGIQTDIMVMNPEVNDFPLITAFRLEPELYNFRILEAFGAYLSNNGIVNYPIHVKIDTGMHRLGFRTNEIKILCDELQKEQFRLISVFSHLAASDEPALDDFSRNQIREFENASIEIHTYTGKVFLRHILNSSGIERFPEAQFDMVRLGIGLYGVSSFSGDHLNEVSSFKTRITQIMELNEGDTVGYGRKGIITSKRKIATLPAGYADGLPRSLGNGKASFLINSEPAPTIGNICMDMCMIDVTDLKVEEGDEVVIFGKDLSVNVLARAAGTIPYEILSNISARVKRIYYRE